MRNIRLVIEYDGTNYVGWQRQPNGIAVQEVLERELSAIVKAPVTLHGSGRTDSGVHALCQVANFETNARMPADKFAYALNAGLPRDIRVRFSGEAPSDFHARFSAKEKTYRYTMQLGPHSRAFSRNTALHLHGPLNIPAMEAELPAIIGEHDFAAFMCANTSIQSTVRTIYAASLTQLDDYLYFDITGNGFLYNMVRIIVGTLLDVGRGILSPGAIQRALATASRSDAGATAPAHGLMLIRLKYPDFDTDDLI
ncbi:MAG: tRNA pseudouridine(38-40) synthase TruA [Eubacteriales bacterium]|nr:tRNA pseudouridine(38-40) synthase TruA [Eubacteriales bacterium]